MILFANVVAVVGDLDRGCVLFTITEELVEHPPSWKFTATGYEQSGIKRANDAEPYLHVGLLALIAVCQIVYRPRNFFALLLLMPSRNKKKTGLLVSGSERKMDHPPIFVGGEN